jgi:hypothetical protein
LISQELREERLDDLVRPAEVHRDLGSLHRIHRVHLIPREARGQPFTISRRGSSAPGRRSRRVRDATRRQGMSQNLRRFVEASSHDSPHPEGSSAGWR